MNQIARKIMQDRKIVEALILGDSFNKISKALKCSKKRIRLLRAKAIEFGYIDGDKKLPPYPEAVFDYLDSEKQIVSDMDQMLLEHLPWIKDRIEVGWTPITIHEELPTVVPKSTFYRFMKRHGLYKKDCARFRVRVISEIIHPPGEALILDWGKLVDVTLNNQKKTLWFLAGVLGHSRFMMVRLVWDNKVSTTLTAIASMLHELGGVPKRIISDNPKCFATLASKYEPVLNPAFERFCQHYGFVAELLPPRDPQKKGKIERMVPFVRRISEPHSDWGDFQKSQEFIDQKISIANERKHGTTKLRPREVFERDERSALKPLPNFEFAQEEYHTGTVREDGHVQFRGKYYSLDPQYIKQEVFIIGTQDLVQIFFKGKSIETHCRVYDAFQSKSTKPQHQLNSPDVMLEQSPYLEKGRELGLWVESMIKEILLQKKGFMDMRSIWGILSLDKKYSKQQIDDACKHCIYANQFGYRAVLRFIDYAPSTNQESPIKGKFVRSITEYTEQLKH